MLNDADCSIDHLITAQVPEHVRGDDLATTGALRFEREWPR